MKYARKVGGTYLDPIMIPQPWPEKYWTNDPIKFCEKMFPGTSGWEQVADAFGEVPAPAAPAIRVITKLEFKLRFTAIERITIRASTDPVVVDFMDLLNVAEFIDLDHPQLVAGVNYLEYTKLIEADRAAELLS